ncbi:MAG: glycosyltransferase [Acidobacteriia bacterium]|nr:glycosyltransferase [Terriglobia bacterium]
MRFSIIIPSFARPKPLHRCLAGLAALDYPRDRFEVIVVDDGNPDPLDEIVREFDGHLRITLVRQANSGPAIARNAGAQHARGEWLGFIDDDCVAHPDWLAQIDDAAAKWPEAMLSGDTVNACSGNVFAELNQILVSTVTRWLKEHDSALHFFPSNNLFCPAASFQRIGGFHPDFRIAAAEDREICARWLASGGEMVEVPEARISHSHPQTLTTFLRMHFRYGRGAATLHRSRNTSPRQFATRGLHTALLRATLREDSASRRVVLPVLMCAAQAAEAAGYIFESLGRSRAAAFFESSRDAQNEPNA